MKRWSDLPDRHWHPGNTHIHYDEKEKRPDERLRLDPRIEDLRMTAVSILKRWDLAYATNKYSPGMLTEFSSAQHYVQCGEENRHNTTAQGHGYGHVMLLNIRNVVHPVSRGLLVDSFDPDFGGGLRVASVRRLGERIFTHSADEGGNITGIGNSSGSCRRSVWKWPRSNEIRAARRISLREDPGNQGQVGGSVHVDGGFREG